MTDEIAVRYCRATGGEGRRGERGTMTETSAKTATQDSSWTFLTNHSHVLLCLVEDPEARMRDVAERVGITERAVQRIVAELEAAGYLVRRREGRRNHYEVKGDLPLRHPVERHRTLSALIALILGPKGKPSR